MWQTWTKAKSYHRMPSEVFDPSGSVWESDGKYGPVVQWMFDSAVTWFGTCIENALGETYEQIVGMGNRKRIEHRPKYTLAKLLNPLFRLPRPAPTPADNPNPWAELAAWAGKRNSGVRRFAYVGETPQQKLN